MVGALKYLLEMILLFIFLFVSVSWPDGKKLLRSREDLWEGPASVRPCSCPKAQRAIAFIPKFLKQILIYVLFFLGLRERGVKRPWKDFF